VRNDATAPLSEIEKRIHAKNVHRVTRARSASKAISWRAVGTLDTFLLGWLITGNLVFAGSIASAEVITKMFLYYFHERAWDRISWGKTFSPKDTLEKPTPEF
jgi:uncharacterized membrane protein